MTVEGFDAACTLAGERCRSPVDAAGLPATPRAAVLPARAIDSGFAALLAFMPECVPLAGFTALPPASFGAAAAALCVADAGFKPPPEMAFNAGFKPGFCSPSGPGSRLARLAHQIGERQRKAFRAVVRHELRLRASAHSRVAGSSLV